MNTSPGPSRDLLITFINGLLSPNDYVLDIGCGTKEIARALKCTSVTTLDAWKPFNPDIWCDLTEIKQLPCENDSYDVILMTDVIEHLPKERGFYILREAKRVTRKYIIVFTPLWWDPNVQQLNNPASPYYGNEHDKHLSLWTPEDFVEFDRIVSISAFENYYLGVWNKNAINRT